MRTYLRQATQLPGNEAQECLEVYILFRQYLINRGDYGNTPYTINSLENTQEITARVNALEETDVLFAHTPSLTDYHFITVMRNGANLEIFQKFGKHGTIKMLNITIARFLELINEHSDIINLIKQSEKRTRGLLKRFIENISNIYREIYGIADVKDYQINRPKRMMRFNNKKALVGNKAILFNEESEYSRHADDSQELNYPNSPKEKRDKRNWKRFVKYGPTLDSGALTDLSESISDEEDEEPQDTIDSMFNDTIRSYMQAYRTSDRSDKLRYEIFRLNTQNVENPTGPLARGKKLKHLPAIKIFKDFINKNYKKIQSMSSAKFQTKKRNAPQTKKTKRRRK